MPFAYLSFVTIGAPREEVFAWLDDPTHLTSHMSTSSWRMGGGRMTTLVDERNAREVGSVIRLSGSAFGIRVAVEEQVTKRMPPIRKEWETIGAPTLLVIGRYRMGFELTPAIGGCTLRVFIDYERPTRGIWRWLGLVFARPYAKWCCNRMTRDAARRFAAAH